MRVFARFRDAGGKRDDGLVVAFPDDKTIETTHARRPDQSFTFTFDKVFEPRAPVEELFSHCVEPAAAHLAAGQHAIIYAYGHGGSGKAATLFGSKDGSEQIILAPPDHHVIDSDTYLLVIALDITSALNSSKLAATEAIKKQKAVASGMQKAHEVLSDTLQRRTYDAERGRGVVAGQLVREHLLLGVVEEGPALPHARARISRKRANCDFATTEGRLPQVLNGFPEAGQGFPFN